MLENGASKLGYDMYFAGTALFGMFGAIAAWHLKRIIGNTPAEENLN